MRILSDSKKLEIAVDLLYERELDEYTIICRQAECKINCDPCAIRQECELKQRIYNGDAEKCENWVKEPWNGN